MLACRQLLAMTYVILCPNIVSSKNHQFTVTFFLGGGGSWQHHPSKTEGVIYWPLMALTGLYTDSGGLDSIMPVSLDGTRESQARSFESRCRQAGLLLDGRCCSVIATAAEVP